MRVAATYILSSSCEFTLGPKMWAQLKSSDRRNVHTRGTLTRSPGPPRVDPSRKRSAPQRRTPTLPVREAAGTPGSISRAAPKRKGVAKAKHTHGPIMGSREAYRDRPTEAVVYPGPLCNACSASQHIQMGFFLRASDSINLFFVPHRRLYRKQWYNQGRYAMHAVCHSIFRWVSFSEPATA